MTHVFPRESESWAEGDLAFCVRSFDGTKPRLERGRVYRISAAMKPRGIGHHALKVEGIDTGKAWGFCSNRFIKLSGACGRLAQIDAATEYTTGHYWEPTPPHVD